MNIVISLIGRTPAWIPPRGFVDELARAFPQHTFVAAADYDMLRRRLPDADAALTPIIDRDIFPRLPRLRWVQVPAAGVTHVLFDELVASPVIVTNARGIRARAIAEHVLGAIIALARQFPRALHAQLAGEWAQDEIESGRVLTLQGRRLGLIGLGSVGTEIARVASAFGLPVSAVRRRWQQPAPDWVDEVLAPTRLHELLTRSDVLVVAAPVTRETRHLIGPREVAAMKQGVLLVNISRGELLQDDAVVKGLASGRIGGAALDVFTHEPLASDSPYWRLPNVLITPHTSGALEDYWSPFGKLFTENIRRFEDGLPLLNEVDKRAGY